MAAALVVALAATPAALAAEALTVQITADAMCCAGCAKKVAAQLYAAPGVIDVQPDVPNRLVTITARPSRNLTLEKLWNAVAKGKGGPSKLVMGDITYAYAQADALPAAERVAGNAYRVTVVDLASREAADRVAESVRHVRGVARVSADAMPDALLVEPAAGATVSPWALVGAVEQAKEQPLFIDGPLGRLTINRTAAGQVLSARPQIQGTVR